MFVFKLSTFAVIFNAAIGKSTHKKGKEITVKSGDINPFSEILIYFVSVLEQ